MDGIQSKLYSAPDKNRCNKLQQYLQEVFYPTTEKGQKLANQYNQMISEIYVSEGRKALKNFNIGDRVYRTDLDTAGQLIRDRFESFSHKQYIERATIDKRLKEVKKALRDLSLSSMSKIDDISIKLNQLKKQLYALQKITTDDKGRIQLLEDQNIYKQVQEMDALYAALSIDTIVSPKDYGDILEYTLNAMNEPVDNITRGMTQELINKIVVTEGSKSTGQKGATIKIPKPENLSFKDKKVYISNGKGSFSFTYESSFNPDSVRQGKMDVKLTLPGQEAMSPFRVSAKNWGALHDLGETPLAYALFRSLGNSEEGMYAYAYTLQDKNNTAAINQAHELAKLAIVADILMGYSQSGGYADTLVINYRAKRQVIVRPMQEIFDQIEKKLRSLKIDGYKDGLIQRNIASLSKIAISRSQDSQTQDQYFQTMSLKYLQSIRVLLKYSSLI